jgi:pimeloyl-ACP methyl ester carboxylesterase
LEIPNSFDDTACYDPAVTVQAKKFILSSVVLVTVAVVALPLVLDTERGNLDEEARLSAPGRFVELGHGQVHYEFEGPEGGNPVVLVHGFSVPSFVWDPTFDALLAKGFRVLRYDLYGRGFSDRPDVPHDRKLYVEQLDELLAALGIEGPVDLVGLSMGGPVVASFADSHPEKVRRLVFIDPFVGPVDAGVLAVPGVGDYLAVYFVRSLPSRLSSDFHNPEKVPDWSGRFREQMRYRGFRRALLRSVRQFMGQDFTEVYGSVGRLNKPTLLVWGRQDQTVPFSESERIAGPLNAEFFVVEDSGHTPHLERPEVFEPKLVEFLHKNEYSEGDPPCSES